ncbi:MAG: methyltransferase, partial [Candidatus Binataceae bacterium]
MTIASGDETVDTILGGRLKLVQPRHGYRFSVDAILLGRFARCRPGARVLELGAGCGVISILIAALHKPAAVAAVELQPALAALIERNAVLNGLDTVTAIAADLRARKIVGIAPGSFDLVVANPPYRRLNSGRQSPNPGRRLARDESGASIAEFAAAAARYSRHGGRVAVIFAAVRAAEVIAELRANRLEPKRIRMVHPRGDLRASTILVEARKGAGVGVEIEPPLILYAAKAVYSDEARA